ncbi:MAG: ZIP family metal transporter [Candidatus Aenigmatarchaeota archaeon]|nr:MAG: ZIP family metal transporter [Candidatus Aenigmarchaeota archaeon]
MFMDILIWVLIATVLNSLLGFIGIFTLWLKENLLNRLLLCFVAFSAGALLGGAFFHLFPESLERISSMNVFGFAIIGFLLFLVIEGFFHWHHCRRCEVHPFSYIMLIGDAIHNLIDGLVIAAGFFASVSLGVITTLMIVFHEAPQELGLFGSLVYAGHEKRKALLYSFLAQSTCILGGVIGYFISSLIENVVPFLIAFAAGGFLYISASDLVPEVHKAYKGSAKRSFCSLGFLIIGILFMLGIRFLGG